jgi:phage shock protein PspC (stress-responsive transcriptional regulator)
VGSVRVLQSLTALAVAAAVIAGIAVAFNHQPVAVSAGVCVATMATFISAALSYGGASAERQTQHGRL